ncbi:MAG: GrpB family protein [Hyphomicrobiales bacterium]|nr:MAG: GrpB family protein [Hyphomicrobiales bacterium]
MTIIISPAQASWPDEFQRLKAALLPLAPAGTYAHHIGSTGVPGLAAKDIIDIQLTVGDLAAVDAAAFVTAGYRKGGHTSDHCPAGMDLPPTQLQKLLFIATHPRRAHIHVRQRGNFNQRFPLICRDYLRSHPVSAAAYELIKQRLAGFFPEDQDAYYDIKDPVFDLIHDAAMGWALHSYWVEPPAD